LNYGSVFLITIPFPLLSSLARVELFHVLSHTIVALVADNVHEDTTSQARSPDDALHAVLEGSEAKLGRRRAERHENVIPVIHRHVDLRSVRLDPEKTGCALERDTEQREVLMNIEAELGITLEILRVVAPEDRRLPALRRAQMTHGTGSDLDDVAVGIILDLVIRQADDLLLDVGALLIPPVGIGVESQLVLACVLRANCVSALGDEVRGHINAEETELLNLVKMCLDVGTNLTLNITPTRDEGRDTGQIGQGRCAGRRRHCRFCFERLRKGRT
jgi:hypothetical protein